MKRVSGMTAALGAALAACFAPAPASAQVALPPGFQQEVVLDDLSSPTSVEFAPDGTIFVAEKSGLIKAFDGAGDPTATVVKDLGPKVHDYWDRGLLDIALDPEYPAQPFIYAVYTLNGMPGGSVPRYEEGPGGTDTCVLVGSGATPPDNGDREANCPVGGRLIRMLVDPATDTAGAEQVLIEDWCQQYLSHSIGSIAFDSEGALYAGGGDGAGYIEADWGQHGTPPNPCGDPPGAQVLPTAQGGVLRSQDLRTSGDPTGLSGSIIRVDRATGLPLPDNPLAGPDLNARRIVAYGLRNPFRFATRPGTDEVWLGDVGWAAWEEVNRIDVGERIAEGSASNFGWPCYEGDGRQSTYGNAGLDLCTDLYDEVGAALGPVFSYQHDHAMHPGDACQDPDDPSLLDSSSISGLDFYEGGVFPAELDGGLLLADYGRECIWGVPLDANGDPAPGPSNGDIVSFRVDAAPVGLTTGNDGAVYYADIGNYQDGPDSGRIMALRYYADGTNQPPTAVASADPSAGRRTTPDPSDPTNPAKYTLNVSFDGSLSTDPDGVAPLQYAWDLDGDGAFDDSTAATPTWKYSVDGTYIAKLRVTDADGATDVAVMQIQVGNTPPRVSIESVVIDGEPIPDLDAAGAVWKVGDTIDFAGSIEDDEDSDELYGVNWTLIVRHCGSESEQGCHSHPVSGQRQTRSGDFTAPDHEHPSHLILRLSATDEGGLQATDSVRLDPRTVELRMASRPAGIDVVVNNELVDTDPPFVAEAIMGSANTIIALEHATTGGREYRFVGWERDGTLLADRSRTQSLELFADADLTAVYELDNDPPVASASATPTSGEAPLEVAFDAGGSSDPDGDSLTYAWDFTADGTVDSTAASASYTYTAPGTHTARLRVTDPDGRSATDEVTIDAGGPPQAVFRFLRTTARADLKVGAKGAIEEVRLLGLRIPGGRGSCEVRGARKKLGRLLGRGDELTLATAEGMPATDRRGRLIRTVSLGRRDIGLALVGAGWARVRAARRFDGIDAYLAAERRAEHLRLGAWRLCSRS